MRRLTIAALTSVLLVILGCLPVASEGGVFLPLALRHAGPEVRLTPGPTPPPVQWSSVLQAVPVFPGARLEFFELRPLQKPVSAVALYGMGPGQSGEVLDWYRRVLPTRGWRLQQQAAQSQRWVQYDAWLEVTIVRTLDGASWLQLAREARAAAGARLTLEPQLRLPPGLARVRFDRADLLREELHAPWPASQARDLLLSVAAAQGWQVEEESQWEGVSWVRLIRGRQSLLFAVRALGPESSEIGVGDGYCLPQPPASGGHHGSVYLLVPAPPLARVDSYAQSDGQVAERWLSSCADLDLSAAVYLDRLQRQGWQPAGSASAQPIDREPATAHLQMEGVDRGLLSVSLTPLGGGSVSIRLSGGRRLRRATAGRSLLFEDLPLPPLAEAVYMARDLADGWDYRERYRLPGGQVMALGPWFRRQMSQADWVFERLEPPQVGPAQVYYGGGEEILVDIEAGGEPVVSFSRRRVCASDEPDPPLGEGTPARRLQEMPVYPGAIYDGFRRPEERYRVRCAGLDLMAGWYRQAMERGDWVQAAVEGPTDPFRRLLLFVRPRELTLPPAARTAWAEVELERTWPYLYRLRLRRDPAGVSP